MRIFLYINILLILVIVFGTKLEAQKLDSKYDEILQFRKMPIDSLSIKILKLKNNLTEAKINLDSEKIAVTQLLLAFAYSKIESYDTAIYYNLKALDFLEKHNDTIYTIFALNNLSAIYGTIRDDEAVKNYAQKSLKLSKKIKDTIFILHSYTNLANIYLDSSLNKAIQYYNKAMDLSEKIGNKEGLINIYINLGVGYFYHDDYLNARKYFSEALSLTNDEKVKMYSALLYAYLAATEYELKRYNAAYNNAITSVNLFKDKNINSVGEISGVYNTLCKTCIKLNKNDEAIKFFELYSESIDEKNEKKEAEQIAKLKILYKTNQLLSENKLLKTENNLKEAKLSASRQRFFLVLVIISLLMFILFYTLYQYIKLNKSYQKIVKENIKTLKLEEENLKLKQAIINNTQENRDADNIMPNSKNADETLFNQIVSYLEDKKPYKDPDFNLNTLAKELNTNRTYISKTINTFSNKSFVEFINEYRVLEAKKLLYTKIDQLTVEAIGYEAGFKSKSTFYRVFKSLTGVTPSFFAKNISLEKKA